MENIESPLSIAIRRFAQENEAFHRNAFGEGIMPFLCRYDPTSIYVENVDGEMVFTRLKAMPIVRYQIGDGGGVVSYSGMRALLADHGYVRLKPPVDRQGPGRKPSPVYVVNPLLSSQNPQNLLFVQSAQGR